MNLEIKLPKPHVNQALVIKSDARFKVMMAGRRFGKSVISQTISIECALNRQHVAYITPTYQLGKMFFKEMCKILPDKVYKKNETDLLMDFITGGSIRFYTGERLDAMRGTKYHLVIIDEASYIPNLEDGWNNSIRPTLTDYKGKAIFLSTPRGKNYFYSLFMRGGEPDWESFKFTTYDNPYMDTSEIDSAKAQLKIVNEQLQETKKIVSLKDSVINKLEVKNSNSELIINSERDKFSIIDGQLKKTEKELRKEKIKTKIFKSLTTIGTLVIGALLITN
jgi:hypothetical protein